MSTLVVNKRNIFPE